MLVAKGVNVVFHGHDHGYAAQQLDSIHYVAAPTFSGVSLFQEPYDTGFISAGGYLKGTLLGNSGYLKVLVSESKVNIGYVGVVLPGDEEEAGYGDGEIRNLISLCIDSGCDPEEDDDGICGSGEPDPFCAGYENCPTTPNGLPQGMCVRKF